MAPFSYFGYLCGYLPMCGLDTQESILATKVSNLRNKSHLYSKLTTWSSNCPNFIATGVPIGLYGQTNKQTDKPKAICSPLFQSWGHKIFVNRGIKHVFSFINIRKVRPRSSTFPRDLANVNE